MNKRAIFTVGHSTRPLDLFIDLLKYWQITAIADVRSSPWSKHNPQFNRQDIRSSLAKNGISYRFYGRQLGGRPERIDLYDDGIANYAAMASTPDFSDGLALVTGGAEKHRLALMCSEHDPINCHRCLLVGRELDARGYDIKHILSEREMQSQRDIEERILKATGNDQHDFLKSDGDPLVNAYKDWSRRVAYAERRDSLLDKDLSYVAH